MKSLLVPSRKALGAGRLVGRLPIAYSRKDDCNPCCLRGRSGQECSIRIIKRLNRINVGRQDGKSKGQEMDHGIMNLSKSCQLIHPAISAEH